MVKAPTLLILGGYGNTGRIIADLLLKFTNVKIVISGRNTTKAEKFALELGLTHDPERIAWLTVDAGDAISLDRALRDIDLVVVASSTSANTRNVAQAVLRAECDYLDINFAASKLKILRSLKTEIEAAGRCFVTDGGFHPGLPAAMIRAAAEKMDDLQEARVSSVISINWSELFFSDETMYEFVRELMDYDSRELIDGKWQKSSWSKMVRHVEFGGSYGARSVYPMWLEELSGLPEFVPSLQSAGFYVGGFNWFVDYFLLPLSWMWMKLAPGLGTKSAGRLLTWGLRKFSSPPYGTVLLLEGSGNKAGGKYGYELRIEHASGYFLTAAPVVACIIQLLDSEKSVRKPGLWFQAHIMNTQRMLSDLEKMGVSVESHEKVII